MTIYGLDIGNAYAYVSVLEVDPRNPATQHADPIPMLPDAYSTIGVPSDAYISADGTITIAQGLSRGPQAAPLRKGLCGVIRAVKTMLLKDEVVCRLPRKQQVTVKTGDVYAAIIQEAVTVANAHRVSIGREPVYDVLLAVPSEFANPQSSDQYIRKVRTCVESILIDGQRLTLRGTIPEPAAAAMDYLHYQKFTAGTSGVPVGDELTAVVYDIGHGSFDTALTRVNAAANTYELLQHDGADVGGKDMDSTLRDLFLSQIRAACGGDEQIISSVAGSDRLNVMANEAKNELSDMALFERDFTLPSGDTVTLRVNRDAFEGMISGLIERTLEITDTLLSDARSKGVKIDCLVLCGGCSRIPCVIGAVQALAADYGLPCIPFRPSQAVSFGAARYAFSPAMLEKYTGYDYSILIENDENFLHGRLQTVLPYNTKLPFTSKTITLDYQHQGVYWLCRSLDKADEALGERLTNYVTVRKLRVGVYPGEQFKAVFSMDEEYVLHVVCRNMEGEVLLQV